MSASKNQQVLLRRRPAGPPAVDDFELVETPLPDPKDSEVLVRAIYLSLDPYMRGRMSATKSYAPPVAIGGVMEGRVVGQVVRSRHPAFKADDIVFGGFGWQAYSAVEGKLLRTLDPRDAPISTALGVLGMPGMTAYIGMTDIGRPKARETVVVSAASGAVGAVAGQLAKITGARVIGIAGGKEKCRYVVDELGFDTCLDHRDDNLAAMLDRHCPDGIDVYFENVGGAVQRAVFPRLNDFARVVFCGMVAEYNDPEPPPGPNLMALVRKRLLLKGFIVSDHYDRFAEFHAALLPLVRDGRIKYREDILDGLENAPKAFIGLLQGRNFGKLIVKIGSDPTGRTAA